MCRSRELNFELEFLCIFQKKIVKFAQSYLPGGVDSFFVSIKEVDRLNSLNDPFISATKCFFHGFPINHTLDFRFSARHSISYQ